MKASTSSYNNDIIQERMSKAEERVLRGEMTSFTAAQILLDTYFDDLKGLRIRKEGY